MSKQPRHIALVANTSWSIYNFRLGLIRALLIENIQVYAIAPRDDYSDKLTAVGATFIPLEMDAYSTSPTEGFKNVYQFYSLYSKYKFDVIIHYTIKANIYGSIAAKLAGCTSIAVVTGLGRTFQFKGISQAILKKIYRLGVTCSKEVWFLNEEDRANFVEERIVKKEKTFLLPSEGVNTRKFKAEPKRPNQSGIIRFLFAGRLLKDKGILEFVSVAGELKKTHRKVKFEVVGFVNPKNKMSVTLDDIEGWQNEEVINYLGSHEDIRPYINRADCLVFPSYYQEGISRILLEAASMSRPIITTDNVGCRDVVMDGYNGLLVQPRSIDSLKDTLERFLALSNEEHRQMGINGRKLVRTKYDEQAIIDIYFKKILNIDPPSGTLTKTIEHGIVH